MTFTVILVFLCYVAFRIISGIDNGLLYAKGKNLPDNNFYRNPNVDVHAVEVLITSVVTLGFWILGMDAIQLYAGWMVASPFFKGFINLASNKPFINPDESSDVDNDGKPGWYLPALNISIPAPFVGRYRLLEAAIGLVLFVSWPAFSSLIWDNLYPLNLDKVILIIGNIL